MKIERLLDDVKNEIGTILDFIDEAKSEGNELSMRVLQEKVAAELSKTFWSIKNFQIGKMELNGFDEYMKDKAEFFKKHGDYKLHDSGMSQNGYLKSYCFDDGADFYELCGPVTEEVEVELHGVKAKVPVKLFRTEYWSSEDSSKFYYEKY